MYLHKRIKIIIPGEKNINTGLQITTVDITIIRRVTSKEKIVPKANILLIVLENPIFYLQILNIYFYT